MGVWGAFATGSAHSDAALSALAFLIFVVDFVIGATRETIFAYRHKTCSTYTRPFVQLEPIPTIGHTFTINNPFQLRAQETRPIDKYSTHIGTLFLTRTSALASPTETLPPIQQKPKPFHNLFSLGEAIDCNKRVIQIDKVCGLEYLNIIDLRAIQDVADMDVLNCTRISH